MLTCLTTAGSLAAARLLSQAGVAVTAAGHGRLATVRWSRRINEFWPGERARDEAAWLTSLLEWGRRSRGHILLAGSDETIWVFARHATLLAKHFLVYAPPIETIETILDKEQLHQACAETGVATVPTWFPRDPQDAVRLAPDLSYPLLIKPRSHVFRIRREKGRVVTTPEEAGSVFSAFIARERTARGDGAPPPPPPVLQQFVDDAVENVVSISGFIDRSGTRFVVGAARKVLQRSRPVGVGLAFETIPADPELTSTALGLCRKLGYFGIFEIEFILSNGRWRLIDFNPRFYQEMALDIAAGLPLPLLAYLDACGDMPALDAAIAACPMPDRRPHLGFTDGFTTTLMMLLRLLRKPSSVGQALRWHWQMRGRLVDATFDWRDPLPSLVHALSELVLGLGAFPRLFKEAKLPTVRHQEVVA